jgi:hypothetical protein
MQLILWNGDILEEISSTNSLPPNVMGQNMQ